MYRRELAILFTLMMVAFVLVAGSTALLVSRFNAQVISIATGTIPDLANSGAFIGRILENWNHVLLIQESASEEDRKQLINNIRANSSTPLLHKLQTLPNTPEQQLCFQRLDAARESYFDFREKYFTLVHKHDLTEAKRLLEVQLKPAYKEYRSEAAYLLKITADRGYHQAQNVIAFTRISVWIAGGLAALIFVVGVFVGFRVLFRGLAFASRLSRSV